MASPAFKIGEQVFPIPTSYRLGDPMLVEDLTGLKFDQFAERLDEQNVLLAERQARIDAGESEEDNPPPTDNAVLLALVGVAVWQTNERWTRDRVRRFVERIDFADLVTEGGDDEEEMEDPLDGAGRSRGGSTSGESTTSPADSLEAHV